MKVFVAGATGMIGRRAVPELVGAGHAVTGLARSLGRRAALAAQGADAIAVDPFDAPALRQALAGYDAVVNLMTRIPPPARAARPGAWRENDRLRTVAAGVIAEAARAAGVERLAQESITLNYPDQGAAWIDEDVALAPAGVPATAAVAEEHARGFGDAVILRFALLYAPDSEQSSGIVAAARRGRSLSLAPASAYVPALWADDAGRAVAAALAAPAGTYNVADDEPLPRRDADAALAAAVGRERLRAPLAIVGRALPPARVLARSQRVSNRRLREATGWAPQVRSAREGWPRIVAALAAEGRARVEEVA